MKIKLEPYAYRPVRAHDTDAGLDICALHGGTIGPRSSGVFRTGLHVELPHGTAGLLVSRSGMNLELDITSTGLIDQNYRGEIMVKLYNHGNKVVNIVAGQRISQLVIIPVLYEPVVITDKLDENTDRGSNGFGSTGK